MQIDKNYYIFFKGESESAIINRGFDLKFLSPFNSHKSHTQRAGNRVNLFGVAFPHPI